MTFREQRGSVYRSMQGKEVDMNKLINQNEMTVAVGNVKVNARGDELGPGGKIIRTREDVLRTYENANAGGVPDEAASKAVIKKPEQAKPAPVAKPAKEEKDLDE